MHINAGIDDGAGDLAGKVTGHASLSAAAMMIGTSLRIGSGCIRGVSGDEMR